MQVTGISKKKLDNGSNTYELGDVSTFGILRINMPIDLQVDTVVPIQMVVTPKHDKYGDYLAVSGEVNDRFVFKIYNDEYLTEFNAQEFKKAINNII